MERYDHGFRRRGGYSRGDWSHPFGEVTGTPYDRGRAGSRPWVGGYREGYQGGSGGMRTGGQPMMPYDGGYGGGGRGPRYDQFRTGGARRAGGRDEWWLGGHHPGRYDESYDEAYQRFDRENRPRFSPVGGTYSAMGGSYEYGRTPRPLRDGMWFSDWTRWF